MAKMPAGVLMDTDSGSIEITSVLWARFRREKSEMPGHLITRLDIMLDRLGMNPSSRSKIRVPKKRENKFDDLS